MRKNKKVRFDCLRKVGAWNARVLDEWMTKAKRKRSWRDGHMESWKDLPLAYLNIDGGRLK